MEMTDASKPKGVCTKCGWYGPLNTDGRMRKHRPATQKDRWGRSNRVQDTGQRLPCDGSHQLPAELTDDERSSLELEEIRAKTLGYDPHRVTFRANTEWRRKRNGTN